MSVERFVVAGTGRSGTGFAARALSALGLPTGHEAVFDHDLETSGTPQRWASPSVYPGHDPYVDELVGDSSLGVVLNLDRLEEPGEVRRLVHLVRNPVDVLRSWLGTPFFVDRCDGRCSPGHPPGAHLDAPYPRAMRARFPHVFEAGTERARALLWIFASTDALLSWRPVEGRFERLGLRLEDLNASTLAGLAVWLGSPAPLDVLMPKARAVLDDLGVDVNRHERSAVLVDELTDIERRLLVELGDITGYTAGEVLGR